MPAKGADRVFVDTNLLVYASRPVVPENAAAREALANLDARGTTMWISPQVLREYLAVVTRLQATAPALPMATAIADVRQFAVSFEVTQEGPEVFERLLDLLGTYPVAGRQVHDAHLVATMLVHGIGRLLTFNAGDFRRYAGEIEVGALPHR